MVLTLIELGSNMHNGRKGCFRRANIVPRGLLQSAYWPSCVWASRPAFGAGRAIQPMSIKVPEE